jgi:glycosyltransferase involved in cell wall biosynthesis
MNDGLVLHVVSPPGGGVDRHVRDIARTSSREHRIWHASGTAEVFEDPGAHEYVPLSPDAIERDPLAAADWIARLGVAAIHVHSMARPVRARAQQLARPAGLPILATLHDILFLDEHGFAQDGTAHAEPTWLAETSAFLRSAAATIVPSAFLADLARMHVPGLDVHVIANGVEPHAGEIHALKPRADFEQGRPRHVVAVLGAIGPHKGSRFLAEIERALAGSDIALVVIGYLDAQVHAGWRAGHLYVHGPYEERHTGRWLAAYGAQLVLFPNRVPESFSYALSEAWEAEVPVLVPDAGALGERVARHGGGWRMPPESDAATVAARLRELLSGGRSSELARVQSTLARGDAARVPTLDAMTRSLDALYRRFALDPAGRPDPTAAPAQALLAANLDATLFRVELARLADELVQLQQGLDAERKRGTDFESESRSWIGKLEADLARVQAELTREVTLRQEVEQQRFALEHKVQHLEAALARLPRFVVDYLLRHARNARG